VHFVTTDITNRFRYGVDWVNGLTASNSLGSVISRLPFNLGKGGFEDDISITGDSPTAADVAALSEIQRGRADAWESDEKIRHQTRPKR
jgi:hypothetical protein